MPMTSPSAVLFFVLVFAAAVPSFAAEPPRVEEDRKIAASLAAMLRAGRAVISEAQNTINDPAAGNKNLGGDAVVDKTLAIYLKTTGVEARSIDATSREGKLLRDEMAAIRQVMDDNQGTINAPGIGFKGFIPAVFSRLVSESFSLRAKGTAEMKVTAPKDLVRNRKARPDAWEAQTIETKFLGAGWPNGQSFEEVLNAEVGTVFRIAVPEYYGTSCLGCHGAPKGELDVTGYPKEGAVVGDLGGVISIKLFHR